MKVECLHGYFKFTEGYPGEISDFVALYGFDLENVGDYYTFTGLLDAPNYSLAGGTFLDCPTLLTFEGEPWEVMRENRLVYDFRNNIVVPLDTVLNAVSISVSGNVYLTNGMILPGSVRDDGRRVTDYSAYYLSRRENFKYSSVGYD